MDDYLRKLSSSRVPIFAARWPAQSGASVPVMFYSAFVHVPNSQMIIELMSNESSLLAARNDLMSLEQRLSPTRLEDLASRPPLRRGLLQPVRVSRAATDLNALDTFYIDGMRTTPTLKLDSSDVSSRCYEWPGANADVCFVRRPDTATSGDFKVGMFEAMLKNVAKNVVTSPSCNMNRWADNHYALDIFDGSFDYIIDYVDAHSSVLYQCADFGVTGLHYIYDPTGWAVQLNMNFSKPPRGCSTQRRARSLSASVNPMCSGGTC